MAEVHIVDIDGEQWDMKDLPLTARVSALETKISGMNSIRHDINQLPPRQPTCLWDCLMNQLPSIDWSFLAKGVWSYGEFEVQSICWGTYVALRHRENEIEVEGTLTYNANTHVFSAFYNPQTQLWDYQIDGEAFAYLQNNILVTQTVDRQYNTFAVPSQLFLRNIGQTTIGNLYAALNSLGLLNRPSSSMLVWDLQRQHNGADLPKGRVGYPAYASSGEFDFSGRAYLQNVRVGSVDAQNNSWIFNWSDGNSYVEANMYGEPGEGIVKSVSMLFIP